MTTDSITRRRYDLLLELRSSGWTSAQALADRLDVSVRTIYRDVEELLSRGIPLEGMRGPEGGYRLRPEAALDPVLLSSEESFSLYLHGEGVSEIDESTDRPSRRLIGQRLEGRMLFEAEEWLARVEGSKWVKPLKSALAANQAVRITRCDRDPPSDVIILPYGIVWRCGEWYLLGPGVEGPIQALPLSTIASLAVTNLTFPLPPEFDLLTAWESTQPSLGSTPTRVVAMASMAARAELLQMGFEPESEADPQEPGDARLVLTVDSWRSVVPTFASFGSSLRVTAPEKLREAIARFLQEAVRHYAREDGRKRASNG